MTDRLVDASTSEGLRTAFATWRVFAREAERQAELRQHETTVELLNGARQVGLALEALHQLAGQLAEHQRVSEAARRSGLQAERRLEARLHAVHELLDAAERTRRTIGHRTNQSAGDRPGRTDGLADDADGIIDDLLDLEAQLQAGLERVRASLSGIERNQERLATAADRVGELRARCAGLSQPANLALESMRRAGDTLESTRSLYDLAQLSSIDLRRGVLAPPTGSPLPGPPLSLTELAKHA